MRLRSWRLAMAPAMLATWGAAAAQPAPTAPPPPVAAAPPHALTGCTPSVEERERLLSLSVGRFDRSDDGWRPYGDAHCYAQAANLLDDYVRSHGATLNADDESLLRFHMAQMLADARREDDAIGELSQVLDLNGRRPSPDEGWRIYVQGTREFLRQNLAGLNQAASDLARYADGETGPVQAGDRLNLNALHGLQRCFGRGYAFAYGSPECRDLDEVRRLNQTIG